ncbi:ribosome biogenesis protein Noc4 [Coprinopsis sp. MPI-PUGE-AT-0042]|nr:ribosome biogenesis protein Noc4 [Coprinopsis sp. MPI-PUGE-AT-0042]
MPTLRSLPPAKKRKIATEDNGSKQLEDEIAKAVEAGTSLNPLADLVALLLSTPDPQDVSKAIYALYRSFVLVITSGKLTPPSSDAAAKTVKTWIWEHLNTYTDFLVGLMKDEEKHLRVSALKILMSLQKHLSSKVSTDGNPQFHLAHFKKIVAGLVLCPRSKRQGSQDVGPPGVLDMDVLNTFYETWLSVHDDIRWFFLRESATLLNKTPSSSKSPSVATITRNLLSILEKLDTFPTDSAELNAWWVPELGTKPPKPKKLKGVEGEEDMGLTEKTEEDEDDDDWRKFFDDEPAKDASKDTKKPTGRLHELTLHQSLHHLGSHRAVFTRCWLVLLPLITSAPEGDVSSTKTPAKAMSGSEGTTGESKKGTRKALSTRVLNILHAHILPHLTRPILVMDWVGNCVDMGGSVGLLALNGLWGLMKGYNLDYPSFYTRLYAFLDRDVLHLKHRARFFRLTEVFLSSTDSPGSRSNAPPAAIIMLIPFTYNVLKKHPALMAMIHRDLSEDEAFTKPNYSVEDFLDHGYGTLFETEVNRKIKKDPPLAMQSGRKIDLFPVAVEDVEVEGAVGDGIGGDLVSELWAFSQDWGWDDV